MRKQTLQNREKIKIAAAELFSEKGYEATSVNDIIARSGNSIGAFYRLFSTKQQIASELYEEETIRLIKEAIEICEKCTDEESFIEALVSCNIKGAGNKMNMMLYPFVQFTGELKENIAEYAYRYRSMIKSKLSSFVPEATEDHLWICARIIHTLLSSAATEENQTMYASKYAMKFSKKDMLQSLRYLVEMCKITSRREKTE